MVFINESDFRVVVCVVKYWKILEWFLYFILVNDNILYIVLYIVCRDFVCVVMFC